MDKNGKKYILEQETENPFVFKRFYNEVTYYGETMRQIREYEEVFEDKLEAFLKKIKGTYIEEILVDQHLL